MIWGTPVPVPLSSRGGGKKGNPGSQNMSAIGLREGTNDKAEPARVRYIRSCESSWKPAYRLTGAIPPPQQQLFVVFSFISKCFVVFSVVLCGAFVVFLWCLLLCFVVFCCVLLCFVCFVGCFWFNPRAILASPVCDPP